MTIQPYHTIGAGIIILNLMPFISKFGFNTPKRFALAN